MSPAARVARLRAEMRRAKLDAYLVPSTDPHQSETTPARWQRRQWLTGFTGSVGDALVAAREAHLWIDSRYFIQAEQELAGSGITLQRQGRRGVPTLTKWIEDHLAEGQVLGVDPELVSLTALDDLRRSAARAGARVRLVERNLVDAVRGDVPPLPAEDVWRHPSRYAGRTTSDKLAAVRALMERERADALVETRLDSIAWLFNIRGGDVEHTPVAVAYGVVARDGAALYIDRAKVQHGVERSFGRAVSVRPYGAIAADLRDLAGKRVWVDPGAASARIGQALKGAVLVRKPGPIQGLKARKNQVEIEGARRAHLRDAVALARFLCWLDEAVERERVTELSAAAGLEALRAEAPLSRGPSFRTISAVGSHGAIVHYTPSPGSDRVLRRGGIYLVDSGGQYLDGTTDVTRTVLLGGEATAEQREAFTRVLKGMIAFATVRFPAGTSGMQLDVLARRSLWEAGLDYGHGTGHGVGSFLGVHESPPGVAPRRMPEVPLEAGHILSNEPGIYRKGRFGVRTENLMLVVRDGELSRRGDTFLRFETLTLCPIDRRLIDVSLLASHERRWLDAYHAEIARLVGPELSRREKIWLRAATRRL